MSDESKTPAADPMGLTDEMLVRMVILLLKDISKLAPYLNRLILIASNPEHTVFKDTKTDARIVDIATRMRMNQLHAFAALLRFLIEDTSVASAGMILGASDAQRTAAVDKAMRDIGIDDASNKGQ